MPYKIMKNIIQSGTKSKEELHNMADVYYAAGRLMEEQYIEITEQIRSRES